MAQKTYFTIYGERVQGIFNDEGVGFSFPYLAKVLRHAPVREDYLEYEHGDEVVIPVTALMRYFEGAGVEVVSE